jgi:hypothetical protein
MKSKFFLIYIIFPLFIFSVNLFAENTHENKSGGIIIKDEDFNPFLKSMFFGSELPYLAREKTLYADYKFISDYNLFSDNGTIAINEDFRYNSLIGLAGYFVVGDIGVGIKIEFNIPKQKSDRLISTPTLYYFIREKKLRFNVLTSIGYKISDNLSLGIDLFYITYYKTIDLYDSGTSKNFYYNIAKEIFQFGASITYKPFSFFRFTYSLRVKMHRMIAHFTHSQIGWPNLNNVFKFVFTLKPELFYINLDVNISPGIGRKYNDALYDVSWSQETVFNLFFNFKFQLNKFYIKTGFLYECIYRDKFSYGDVSFEKQHDNMYTYLYGFSVSFAWHVTEEFKFSIDFNFKRHLYIDPKDIWEVSGGTSYNKYVIYINTRYKLP